MKETAERILLSSLQTAFGHAERWSTAAFSGIARHTSNPMVSGGSARCGVLHQKMPEADTRVFDPVRVAGPSWGFSTWSPERVKMLRFMWGRLLTCGGLATRQFAPVDNRRAACQAAPQMDTFSPSRCQRERSPMCSRIGLAAMLT